MMDGTDPVDKMSRTAMTVTMEHVTAGTVTGAERAGTALTNVVCGTAGAGLNLARIIGALKTGSPGPDGYTESGSACEVWQPSVLRPRQYLTSVPAAVQVRHLGH